MAHLIELATFSSESGNLTVFETIIPGSIKRLFYIYGAGNAVRAGHRHRKAWNALICLNGSCRVYVHDGQQEAHFLLNEPQQCLIIEPRDWHTMDQFTEGAILLVVSNELYDKADYIYQKYQPIEA